jgi:hypothetical protein
VFKYSDKNVLLLDFTVGLEKYIERVERNATEERENREDDERTLVITSL